MVSFTCLPYVVTETPISSTSSKADTNFLRTKPGARLSSLILVEFFFFLHLTLSGRASDTKHGHGYGGKQGFSTEEVLHRLALY